MRVVGELAPDLVARLALATKIDSISDALHLGDLVDSIAQDEFTHDVIVRAAAPAHLVFDTT